MHHRRKHRGIADNLSSYRQKSRPENHEVLATNQSKRRGTKHLRAN
ncbi:hypothetical protein ES703_45150 [subsurface metagenome]